MIDQILSTGLDMDQNVTLIDHVLADHLVMTLLIGLEMDPEGVDPILSIDLEMDLDLQGMMIDQILSTGLEMGLVVTRNLEDQGDLKNLVAGVDRSLEAVRTTEVLEEMILHHLGGVVEDGNDYDGSFEFLGGPEVFATATSKFVATH